jgi:hypothetical protein
MEYARSLSPAQTEKMPPISIFLRIQCSPLEILGFHGKFFCYHLLSNVLPIFGICCYHLLFFQTPQVSTHRSLLSSTHHRLAAATTHSSGRGHGAAITIHTISTAAATTHSSSATRCDRCDCNLQLLHSPIGCAAEIAATSGR